MFTLEARATQSACASWLSPLLALPAALTCSLSLRHTPFQDSAVEPPWP